MPTTPWKKLAELESEKSYLALLTYLPLRHYRSIPRFITYTRIIQGQLDGAAGLIGYSLRARIFKIEFWTLSVWQDEAALRTFVFSRPHNDVMHALRDQMGPTKFVRWQVSGAGVPPSWEDALRRFEQERGSALR